MKQKLQELMAKIAEHKALLIRVGAGVVGAVVGAVVAGMLSGDESGDEVVVEFDEGDSLNLDENNDEEEEPEEEE